MSSSRVLARAAAASLISLGMGFASIPTAFADDDAAGAHVNSEHFATATRETLSQALVATPKIISQTLDQQDWNELGELAVP